MPKLSKIIKKELDKCKDIYPDVKFKYKIVYFKSSKKRTVAYYSPSRKELGFNLYYLSNVKKKFVKEVARHEIGHLINRYLNGRNVGVHGKEWRAIMYNLGSIKPRATIDFSSNSRSFKTSYTMRCKCSKHSFSENKRTRLLNGTIYICNKCNKKIKER